MRHLLTITPDFPPAVGGIQLLLGRLIDHLPDWRHTVLCRPPGVAAASNVAVRTTAAGAQVGNLELNFRAALTALRERPDAVLLGHVALAPSARLLHARAPVVTYAYADELTHRPWMTRRAIRHSDYVVAISRYTAEVCVEHGSHRDRLAVIPPGVDHTATAVPLAALRTPTILTVARLADHYKGFDVVMAAMPRILAHVPDARWLIAGDGPLRSELESSARAASLGRSVDFLGRVSDERRAELLAAADVFVMPSRLPPRGAGGEGFGIVYLEAAGAGVPVVAGNVAGALDAVSDGVTGLLVDPTDPSAVADALIAILTDPARAAAMGAASREWARRFTWERMAGQVEAVLLDAIARRPVSRGARDPLG